MAILQPDPGTSGKNKSKPMDLAEIKTLVSRIQERHTKFYDAGRHIEPECEICWVIKTIKALVAELEKKMIYSSRGSNAALEACDWPTPKGSRTV